MPDRITEILVAHLDLARRQLAFMREGVSFSVLDDNVEIPTTEQELLVRVANLERSYKRHLARNT